MKAKLLRPLVSIHDPDHWKTQKSCEFPEPPKKRETKFSGRRIQQPDEWIYPAGTIIESIQSYRLVQQGVALPVDDECQLASGYRTEMRGELDQAYRRVEAGIHPDDYAAFDAGLMIGYDGDGNPVPGPNYVEPDDDTDEEDDEFSDDDELEDEDDE